MKDIIAFFQSIIFIWYSINLHSGLIPSNKGEKEGKEGQKKVEEGIPIQHRHDIQELQHRPDGEGHAPEKVLGPEAQDADHSKIGSEPMDRHLHHLARSTPQQRQPCPRQEHRRPTSHPVERPIGLRKLRRPAPLLLLEISSLAKVHPAGDVGEPVDVEPVGAAESVNTKEGEPDAEGEQVEDKHAEPEHVPPAPHLLRCRPWRRGRRQRGVAPVAAATSVLREIKKQGHG
ncbi:hypothetical protein BHE74_00035158 [Ensete ventricosum]|nr:hypothetical protein GW17_00035753 [Ensete ventricosum]RWW58036.1 hypothetical protein BHE74_00035158 [Ensete ventricosum]